MTEKKYALLIASFEYDDPYFRRLEAPAQDVKALARVLGDPAMGAFGDVKILLNEPSPKLLRGIEDFFANRTPEDLLLLYFSGHGVKDEGGRLYYATKDTLHNRLVSTALPAYQVNHLIEQSRSRRKILVLDCCYSGAFSKAFLAKGDQTVGVMEAFKQGHGLVTLTASDAFQYSFEEEGTATGGVCSVFTRALVEGIETGDADVDTDQLISLEELYDYAYKRVRLENPSQTPRIQVEVEGKLFVARNPQPPRPAELPSLVREAIGSVFVSTRLEAIDELGRLLHGRNKGLELAAHDTLQKLTQDDSLKVRSAAQKCVDAFEQEEASRLKAEQEQLAREKAEQERLRLEKAEAERQAAEAERVARERAEKDRMKRAQREAAGREEAERRAREEAEQVRLARVKAEQERLIREIAEEERLELERAEQERLRLERAEAERQAAETEALDRERGKIVFLLKQLQLGLAAKEKEEERLAGEKAKAERRAAKRAEAEGLARAKLKQKRVERQRAERPQQAPQKVASEQESIRPRILSLAQAYEQRQLAEEKAEARRDGLSREQATRLPQRELADLIGAKGVSVDWRRAFGFWVANLMGPLIVLAFVRGWESIEWIVLVGTDSLILTGCALGALRRIRNWFRAAALASATRAFISFGWHAIYWKRQVAINLWLAPDLVFRAVLVWAIGTFVFLAALEFFLRRLRSLWLALLLGSELAFVASFLSSEGLVYYNYGRFALPFDLFWGAPTRWVSLLYPLAFASVFWLDLCLFKKQDQIPTGAGTCSSPARQGGPHPGRHPWWSQPFARP